jgi:hypothetical protein
MIGSTSSGNCDPSSPTAPIAYAPAPVPVVREPTDANALVHMSIIDMT